MCINCVLYIKNEREEGGPGIYTGSPVRCIGNSRHPELVKGMVLVCYDLEHVVVLVKRDRLPICAASVTRFSIARIRGMNVAQLASSTHQNGALSIAVVQYASKTCCLCAMILNILLSLIGVCRWLQLSQQ